MQFLELNHFAPLLNQSFSVAIGPDATLFTLVEATPLPVHAYAGMVRAPFSLLFLHAAAVVLPQQIYTMKHERLGEFGIFLVPIARNKDGFVYQAVFN